MSHYEIQEVRGKDENFSSKGGDVFYKIVIQGPHYNLSLENIPVFSVGDVICHSKQCREIYFLTPPSLSKGEIIIQKLGFRRRNARTGGKVKPTRV